MLTVKSLVLKCPFCGATKEVVKPNPEITPGGTLWSDGVYEDPKIPQPSPVQHCPECGRYYLLDEAESHECDHETDALGRVSLSDTKYIYLQYKEVELTEEQRTILYMTIIRAFNDEFRRYPDSVFLEGVGLSRIDRIRGELLTFENVDIILKGELLRERRRYDESIAMLEKAKKEQPDKGRIIDQIIEQAKNHNHKVFKLRMAE